MQTFDFDFGTPMYDASIRLRDEILRKPLGLDFTAKQLNEEYRHIHLGAFDKYDNLLGCLVLEPMTDNVFKMRQVAVVTSNQSKGIGTLLVRASEQFLKNIGGTKITLNARDTALKFYRRMQYQIIGDEFVEVGIPHFKMEKVL